MCLFVSDTSLFFSFISIAIEGLPFEVNSKFEILWKKSGVSFADPIAINVAVRSLQP